MVDPTGEPDCRTLSSPAPVGELCDLAEGCERGSGCLRLHGLARCLPFCRPDTAAGAATCVRAAGPASQCAAVLPDRPDIGACVIACADPSAPFAEITDGVQACPGSPTEALTCGVPPELDFAVCTDTVGEVPAGGTCGPTAPCGPGLICTPRAESAVCRAAFGSNRLCTDEELRIPHPTARFVELCEPCPVISGPLGADPPGTAYLACKAEEVATEATARCVGDGAAMVAASDTDTLSRLAIAAGALYSGASFWVTTSDSTCARLDQATGEVSVAPCGSAAQALCRLTPPTR